MESLHGDASCNMHQVIVSLGSNNQQEIYFTRAFNALNTHFKNIRLSPIYKSKSANHLDLLYFNNVVVFSTTKNLTDTLALLDKIEIQCDRKRPAESNIISMDIDLLLFDDQVTETPRNLPHPDIIKQAYILRPLADLLPEVIHPTTAKSFQTLWLEMSSQDYSELTPVEFIWDKTIISIDPVCQTL